MNSNQILIESVSPTKTEKKREDGKVSRQYYTLVCRDAASPFGKTITRNFFQSHIGKDGKTAMWKTAKPSEVASLVGKTIEGEIKTAAVAPYEIEGRTASNYSTVVFKGEFAPAVFKSQGHPMLEGNAIAVAEKQEAEPAFGG